MNLPLPTRLRIYAYFFILLGFYLVAQWAWWAFPENELLEYYRDMGLVESFQIIFLGLLGFAACLLNRYEPRDSDNPLLAAPVGQTVGAFTLVLIFRELDFFMTYFMDEPLYLNLLATAAVVSLGFAAFNARIIWAAVKRLIHIPIAVVFGAGIFIYLVLAQVVGHKVFRMLFYPNVRNFSRRFIEENLELVGLFILCAGMFELHLWLRGQKKIQAPEKTNAWTEDLWRLLHAPGAVKPAGEALTERTHTYSNGGSPVMTQERTLTSTKTEIVSPEQFVLAAERVSVQIEELKQATHRLRRSNTSMAAAILIVGVMVSLAILWHGYVERETAIENSTNKQIEILIDQNARQKRWWQKPRLIRYEELRNAVRGNVTEEYNFGKLFMRKAHRD